ncbi:MULTISPECIES: metal ABC transporter permease [Rothia]|uniref:Metal ABC transporter permease n=1 Tax=Rothia kristinae TaxID=37923 RepID=A0A7T3F9L0_9MICC|nr:metal ABC transporter permease [Rothia kristinae]TDP56799.1 zinc/manganese transport system permease protein [Kocuria sp. AG109]SIL80781.1 ABC-type Mn2+/Zn2+ transport system, permease component [Mycobacteroides abscessus subsp. abscessus]MCA1169583.1 metal ABC transporter permease [Rothia kristinae]MCT1357707.1 metal ABC transporter permease [Rothia kristinae]MCT1393774.1 metal ABC transporter permease [Rothia kristinae]
MSPAILAALAHPGSVLLGQETGFWQRVFVFEDYGELLQLLYPSIIAGAILAVIGGVTGVFVTLRDSAFAVHGIAELSFAGAALALLIGADVVTGSLVGSVAAALLIGLLGSRTSRQQSVIGTLMPFGLGLGILFLSLYQGRSANRFSLLTGQIVSVDAAQIGEMALGAVVVVGGLLLLWRPLTFASVDPQVAAAKGVPLRALSLVYMLLLGVAVALSVQVVGALLVLALLITPAAAANRLTASPVRSVLLSVLFAEVAMVGGILLALAGSLPISPYVTTISFAIFLVCTGIQAIRRRHSASGRRTPAEETTAEKAVADRGHRAS